MHSGMSLLSVLFPSLPHLPKSLSGGQICKPGDGHEHVGLVLPARRHLYNSRLLGGVDDISNTQPRPWTCPASEVEPTELVGFDLSLSHICGGMHLEICNPRALCNRRDRLEGRWRGD